MDQLHVWRPARRGKPKLARSLSWVVGAELLSRRFSHIPQYDDIEIFFRDRPLDYSHRMERVVREQLRYPVFTASYWPIGPIRTYQWSFIVCPVEGRRRAAVRVLLEATAFPSVDTWLCEPKTETWLAQPHHLRCIFNQTENRIDVKEEDG